MISVSKKAILDLDVSKTSQYAVQVMAIDNGSPLRETAQTTVLVNIFDVNNKPPEFLSNANQNVYISEKTPIGNEEKQILFIKKWRKKIWKSENYFYHKN